MGKMSRVGWEIKAQGREKLRDLMLTLKGIVFIRKTTTGGHAMNCGGGSYPKLKGKHLMS